MFDRDRDVVLHQDYDFDEPLTMKEPGRTVIAVDVSVFRAMDEAQKEVYRANLLNALDEALDNHDDIAAIKRNVQGKLALYTGAGQVYHGYEGVKLVTLNSERVSAVDYAHASLLGGDAETPLPDHVQRELQARYPNDLYDEIIDYYTQRHEIAHALYDMREPGADAVAAHETITRFGEKGLEIVRFIADMRAMDVLGISHLNIGKREGRIESYGYETKGALDAVLNGHDQGGMPDDAVMKLARRWDKVAEDNATKPLDEQPEMKVYFSFRGWVLPGQGNWTHDDRREAKRLMYSQDYPNIFAHVKKVKESDIFGEGSAHADPDAEKMLDDLIEAFGRFGVKSENALGMTLTPEAKGGAR